MTRLDEFVHAAHRRIADGHYALTGDALTGNGSLVQAIANHKSPVIAELKPSSPSEGRILQGRPEPILQQFVEGGAAAISCLADSDFFDGSPELVRSAHATGLPVLWKDFIVDPAQIAAAAHNGASAVLLIERILTPDQRELLVQAAHAAGLEVLLEVFNSADWQTAAASEADLIGVNARDLDTLEVDASGALDLLAAISAERKVVALSGIQRRAQRHAAMDRGACAVLVGTHIMKSHDPRLALAALQRPLAKVCGLSTEAMVELAADAGADLVGFVVGAPKSPRNIEPLLAQQLSDHAKALGLRTALVTPHEDDWEVREWCRLAKPDYLQFHGLTPDADWLHSLSAIPTTPVHVVRPGETPPEGAFVLDPSDGSGARHDWPENIGDSAALSLVAGGLNGETAPAAIQATQAWGADASSGLESSPGVKDAAMVRAYVEACHGA